MTRFQNAARKPAYKTSGSARPVRIEVLENRNFFAAHVAVTTTPTVTDTDTTSAVTESLNTQQFASSRFADAFGFGSGFGFIRTVNFGNYGFETFVFNPQFQNSTATDTSSAQAATSQSSAASTSTATFSARVQTEAAQSSAQAANLTTSDTEAANQVSNQTTTPVSNDTNDAKAVVDTVKVTATPTDNTAVPTAVKQGPVAIMQNVPIAYGHIGPVSVPVNVLPSLLSMVSMNIAAGKAPTMAAQGVHHTSDQSADTLNVDATATKVAAPSAAEQTVLATLNVGQLATRPLWQRIAAVATTAVVLVVAWVVRRKKQRSLSPTGEHYGDLA